MVQTPPSMEGDADAKERRGELKFTQFMYKGPIFDLFSFN